MTARTIDHDSRDAATLYLDSAAALLDATSESADAPARGVLDQYRTDLAALYAPDGRAADDIDPEAPAWFLGDVESLAHGCGVFLVADGERGTTYVGTSSDLVEAHAYGDEDRSWVAYGCPSCVLMAANGEVETTPDEPDPLGLVPDHHSVVVDSAVEPWFSWSPCHTCGGLAGERYPLIITDESADQ